MKKIKKKLKKNTKDIKENPLKQMKKKLKTKTELKKWMIDGKLQRIINNKQSTMKIQEEIQQNKEIEI